MNTLLNIPLMILAFVAGGVVVFILFCITAWLGIYHDLKTKLCKEVMDSAIGKTMEEMEEEINRLRALCGEENQ